MFKNPESMYESKRSNNMLKWKPVLSAEAKVVNFNQSSRDQFLGSFQVQLVDNPSVEFKLSGKMSREFRTQYVFKDSKLIRILSEDVPQLGSIVTFEYMTLSSTGVPRQAVFVGTRLE